MQDLLELAFDDPAAASRIAEETLAGTTEPIAHSFAHQCLALVAREEGDLERALARLQEALIAARRGRSVERECDIRSTLGITLVFGGRTRAGLAHLARAVNAESDRVAAKALMLQAMGQGYAGRFAEARESLLKALHRIRADGDALWEARTLNNLAHVELRLGLVADAASTVATAERLFRERGAAIEALDAVTNRGEVAVLQGDLPRALRWFSAAARGSDDLGLGVRPELAGSWFAALLAAGLPGEAIALLSAVLDRGRPPPAKAAELRLALAEAYLADGRPVEALASARKAAEAYRAQHRDWHLLRARLAILRAQAAVGALRNGAEPETVALALDRQSAEEAPLALTLAGRFASADGRRELWRRAASYKSRANGLVRASAYLAGALEREETGDRGGVLRACGHGLDALDEHRRLMGSSELRALATTHGRELTEIALRHAAHDPRTLLRWSERTRATALAQPPATSDAATIPASLAALRDNGRRLAEARQNDEPTEELEKERLRLERAVRTESHTQSADTDPQRPASAEEIVAGVGDGCLVELVDVDGCLHVLVVHNGRVRRKVAGKTQEVADLLGPTAMLLRRASRGRPANTADIGRRLQETILGDAARLIPDGPVVLAPTARLHGLAWSLLPTLHDRPFSVVPSAGQWLRAREVRRPRRRRTLLVAGPHLESGGAEVPVLAERHPDATLLDGPAATVTAVLDQLDGADLAHLATHGRFRADSPLFSSLDLADGPLTVHDLERLPKAPYRVVLSACESGVLAPVGAQELLGLAAALFSIGTAGLVSSIGEVNDAATADLMVGLHDELAKGADPATALLRVRQAAADHPVAAGTAAAFVALGV